MSHSLIAGVFALVAMQSYPTEIEAPDQAWRTPDPENVLYFDLKDIGRVVVETYPEFAPEHVERMKTFARDGFYEGVVFHRVIPGFMAQGGDPDGTGRGGSDLPNLKLEATRRADRALMTAHFGSGVRAAQAGFHHAAPVYSDGDTVDDEQTSWIAHCRGVASMARRARPADSANSQFFFMFDTASHLDREYSAWGRVIWGMPNVDAILDYERTGRRVVMESVRVAADVPEDERTPVEVLDTGSDAFRVWLTRQAGSANIDVCAVEVPARVPAES